MHLACLYLVYPVKTLSARLGKNVEPTIFGLFFVYTHQTQITKGQTFADLRQMRLNKK